MIRAQLREASPIPGKEIAGHKCEGVINSVAKLFTSGSQVEPQMVFRKLCPRAVIYFVEAFLRGL